MSPALVRNTLLSSALLDRVLSMPRDETAYGALLETILRFQQMKGFASEIHTEIHLVKPILKILGYAFESKPKFFEDNVKEPDFALFRSEEERAESSRLWGTPAYFAKLLGLLLVKRYGRKLDEGISGFYLDFESGIPLHQLLYLVKRSRTPWGVLTNGRDWVLLRRPAAFEKRMVQINLEGVVTHEQPELVHVFYHLFCANSTRGLLPELLEAERSELVEYLQRRKRTSVGMLQGLTKKVEICSRLLPVCHELAPGKPLPATAELLKIEGRTVDASVKGPTRGVNEYDHASMFSYLFNRRDVPPEMDLARLISSSDPAVATKDQLFSMRILDMTPGFGAMASYLLDGLSYIAFRLPYRERNRFVAEWEQETGLNRFILDNMLYGAERFQLSFDVLQNAIESHIGCRASNYRFGNPLLGMSLADIEARFASKKQSGLFDAAGDVFKKIRELYGLYFSLSDRIKEDAEQKQELVQRLMRYRARIGDIMDLGAAGFFMKGIPTKVVKELVQALDDEESVWERARSEDWFAAAKLLARRAGFFHMELEFPFLLNDAFDLIFVQPLQNYLWEESVPLPQISKTYVKRALAYLKPTGRIVVVAGGAEEELRAEFERSKRFDLDVNNGSIVLKRR